MAEAGLAVAVSQAAPFPIEIAFEVAAGEVLALVGPSGSGKTTTLRAIAGHHRPERGRVVVDGDVWIDTAAGIDRPARRRRVGFVPQSYALFPHLTALDNVVEAMRDRPRAERREAAAALLARVHLGDAAARRPAELSGGQQQRVALARALARRPSVLLLDEPFSAVDRQTREQLHRALADLRSAFSMPTVLVTHDLDDAARLADRAILLSAGTVTAAGAVGDVLARLGPTDGIDIRSAAAILTARVGAHDPAGGLTVLDHPAGRLFLPLVDAAVGTTVRLIVHARDVSLAVGEPGRLSIRNRLVARVTGIVPSAPPSVEVHLDAAGAPLVASVTAEAVAELGLAPGTVVTALVKSMALDRGAF